MLISCPRCGFSQPKDQYCAQCGVDMQSFKQKKQPTSTRMFSSVSSQIGILLIIAILIEQFIFRHQEPQKWVQKLTPFQSQTKQNKAVGLSSSALEKNDNKITADDDPEPLTLPDSASSSEINGNTENKTMAPAQRRNFDENPALAPPPVSNSQTGQTTAQSGSQSGAQSGAQSGSHDLNSLNFKVTYAEVAQDILVKWIADSSELGLYQNLTDYSAGIIHDYKKRGETFSQTLKSATIKLNIGNSNSNLSGTMTNDGSQMLGLVAAIEYKSNENEIIHGNINITKSNALGSEVYPAEFSLPKGSIFFMVGAIKRDNFTQERSLLTMPPFQIFKSPDFMTRKTEFVIIVEPDYK
jgi:hypothetical protein